MPEYRVKLIMSEEYIIKAKSKEKAEQEAKEKFGCDYYIDSVETVVTKPYDFECNLSEEYKACECCDEWGSATLWLNESSGVEYNFCVDNGCNSSAIYKMYCKEVEVWETDYSTFEHYEIDFENENWRGDLESVMYEVAKKFFEDKQRFITLTDGTDMGGKVIVFKTNAPVDTLKELEKISNDVYINGGYEEDVPIWADVLANNGYVFDYVDEYDHVSPFGTSSEWLEEEYPQITECYTIDNQPKI